MKVLIQRSHHSLELFKCLVSGLKCEECLRTTATCKCVKCDCVYCTQCFGKVRGRGGGGGVEKLEQPANVLSVTVCTVPSAFKR